MSDTEEKVVLRHERIEAAALAGNMEEAERLAKIPHTKSELAAEYATMPRTCRGALSEEGRKLVDAAFEAGDHAAAKQLDAQHRKVCGQDVNALILAGELDGKDKEVECPKCGLIIKYRPPIVEG